MHNAKHMIFFPPSQYGCTNGDEMAHVCCCLKRWLGCSSRGSCVSLPCLLLPTLCFSGCAVVFQAPVKKPPFYQIPSVINFLLMPHPPDSELKGICCCNSFSDSVSAETRGEENRRIVCVCACFLSISLKGKCVMVHIQRRYAFLVIGTQFRFAYLKGS